MIRPRIRPLPLLRRLLADRSGATAVEMAVILPLLLVILVHFIDFGLAFHHRTKLEGAARAAAQQALIDHQATGTIQAVALATLDMPDDGQTGITVSTSCECAGAAASCTAWCADGSYPATYMTVRVTRPFTDGIGFIDMPTIFPTDGVAHVRVQ